MKKRVSTVSFQLLVPCGIEKKIVRENEKNENESEDGVLEHSKVQRLKVERSVRNFEPRSLECALVRNGLLRIRARYPLY